MSITYIPGPSNEMVIKVEPSHSQFPLPSTDVSVSSSFAENADTASYVTGTIVSSSYANTASYVVETANWSQTANLLSVSVSPTASFPYPIISASIVNTTGCPVFIAYSGDMDAYGQPGASGRVRIYRDSVPVGTSFHFYTQSTFGSNPSVSVSCIDSPGTGSFTYYLKLVTLFGSVPVRFGNENGGNLSVFEIG